MALVCVGDFNHQILYNLSINVYTSYLRLSDIMDDGISDMMIDHFKIIISHCCLWDNDVSTKWLNSHGCAH